MALSYPSPNPSGAYTPDNPLSTHAIAQHGFTLIEMLIAIILMGILLQIWASNKSGAFSAFSTAQDATQEAENKRLASVLIDYAATISPTGALPAPVTTAPLNHAITDGTNAQLIALLVEARIRPEDANNDGSAGANVRVYQTVTNQTITQPLYTTFGPSMTLTYSEASIHSTRCPTSDACNTGTPGSSGTLTSVNLNSYKLSGEDYGLTRFSTLAIHKQKLAQTADNIAAIRDRMQELFRERQRTANANDTTNFYPRQISAVAGASRGKTSDCNNDGWYRLDTTDILTQIGLVKSINGKTAWGGTIDYCPDYDALAAGTPDAPPHFAALRILTNPSTGGSPAYGDNTGSTIIPF